MIPVRNKKEIESLRLASLEVALALELASSMAKPGVSLLEIDKAVEDYMKQRKVIPAFKGLYGFPNAVCISLNEVVIHGIPTDYKLKEGDIVGFDIGSNIDGWYGDGAVTVGVGNITDTDKKLLASSFNTLNNVIDNIKVGMRFKEISHMLEQNIKSSGFVPLEGYCGHGIGRKPHDAPEIPNYATGALNSGPKVKEGMVFCLEPMVCQKDGRPKVLADKWSVVSMDGLNASHHEHTVAIVDGRAKILTQI
ncbi:type I methionyl aminopeptidase [Helicobacter sp. 13S00401-1]|uniref:type I methionyl aminopeptidase n=1 Tax=Helicobacter sp. 13S00401-1 TaxID=1905758 RepID=UPI000BA79079|nr:type I methionyl aminopeptidase [Helicobacter sp. 13S00401-1]PAF51149.1 type I methionyl aminopeptidase [Helicobacter sp. 13S00401-1]